MTQTNGSVTSVTERPKQLREAKSREGMRQLGVWLPERMHYELAKLRLTERISINDAIREAVQDYLAARKRQRSKRRSADTK